MNDLPPPSAASPSNDRATAASAPSPLEPNLSGRGFYVGLYLEHLEEVSFLYEQRPDLLDDQELTWLDLEDFEERFEAHIDALVLGEGLALAVCRQQAREGDYGEAHAAVRVFCRQNRRDLVQEVLEELDWDDEERVQAVRDALCHELPESWQPFVLEMLAGDDAGRRRLAARVAGYRRLPAGAALLAALERSTAEEAETLIRALGRLRYGQARVPLYERYLQHEDEANRMAAALALLRLGEPQAVHFCEIFARSQPWALLPVGLGGGQGCVPLLIEVASSGQASEDGLLALGLLGHTSAVDVLLVHLNHEERAEAAATALNLITGAACSEEVLIPDELDEDALFEDERERLRRGEPLTPPGEPPPGTTISRLSQDPETWQAWWIRNQGRFHNGLRYRSGKPYSPACLLEQLRAETSTRRVRQWACEELVIRYGLDVAFETDLFVVHQRQVLARVAARVETHGSSFQEGKWYFAGRPAP